jgi:hypothetical protein
MDRLGAASTGAEESGAPVLSLVKIGPALRVWRAWMAGSAEMVASRKGLGNSGGEASQRLQSPQRPSPTALISIRNKGFERKCEQSPVFVKERFARAIGSA